MGIFETALGPDHIELGFCCHNLAAVRASERDYDAAERLYMRALLIKEAHLGADHPDVALTMHNLAVLRAEQGRDDEARVLLECALRIFESRLDGEHPRTRACRDELDALAETVPRTPTSQLSATLANGGVIGSAGEKDLC